MQITLKKILKAFVPYGIVRYFQLTKQRKRDAEKLAEKKRLPELPRVIPADLFNVFTLDNTIPAISYFKDSRVLEKEIIHNTIDDYNNVFNQLDFKIFKYYGDDIKAFYDVVKAYPLKDKTVLIWGLAACNCDAIALWAGAKKVIVVEYNKPICDHPQVLVYNQQELAESNETVDVAFSYSSFEHDGLGRYGDPINPNGDLIAMKNAHKYLKDDGLLFFGVPLGKDCLCWNAHRIYGPIRLTKLLQGWQLIDVFDRNEIRTPNYPFDLPFVGSMIQNILVLKKINTNYPDDEYLLRSHIDRQVSGLKTQRLDVLDRINKIIYNMTHE